MDFGALPPEINSARIYAGPGSGSMEAAATAWNGLAAELRSAASVYGSVISELADESWTGPSSTQMAAAAAPYVAWLSSTAAEAEQTASQAIAAAAAYHSAFAMTVPPAEIAANRTQLAALVATNIYGQNTPAIATTETQYGEMWAQDATAMYGYAANSSATKVTPFTAAPQTTNQAGSAAQSTAVAAATSTATGTGAQSTLSQLLSSIQSTLQSLVSPSSSATSTSGLSTLLSDLLGTTSSTTTTGLGGLTDSSGFSLGGLLEEYAYLPGFAGVFVGLDALGPLMGTPISNALSPVAALADAGGAAEGAAGGADAAAGELGGGFAGGAGGFADLAAVGEAPSVGALSVPPSWAWASTPQALLGGAQLASALPGAATGGVPLAAGLPMMMGGIPRAAGVAAAAGVGGAVASKYGPRLIAVSRSPAAGYAPDPESGSPHLAYPVPAGFSMNGHAPPGYTPAIVYLPTNGHAPHTK